MQHFHLLPRNPGLSGFKHRYCSLVDAFEGKVALDDEVTADEWGSFYSAFAPIYSGNEVVGIVGVDCIVLCVVIQFMTRMEQFSELSLGLNRKLAFIEENIDRMMTAIGEESESISVVTANAEKISGKMQILREESHVNEQSVNELAEVLSRFTV